MEITLGLKKTVRVVPIDSLWTSVADADGVVTDVETKQYNWNAEMQYVAQGLEQINLLSGTVDFPFPIPCNPNAIWWVDELDGVPAHWEGEVERVLGNGNTPPTPDKGLVTVVLNDYQYLLTGLFPTGALDLLDIAVGDAPTGVIAS